MSDRQDRWEKRETIEADSPIPYDDEDTGVINIPPAAHTLARVNTMKKQGCLLVLAGMDMGKVITLTANEEVLLGRGAECNVTLRDDGISRHHAKVRHNGENSVEIWDLQSTNGTFVAGHPITSALLGHGEKILLGRKTVLKFMLQDDMDLQYQQEMFESSTRDGLTGTYNRKYLTQKIISDLSFARRHHLPFTYIMFDVDFFKKVNDVHGHPTGDAVLVGVAKAVQDTIRNEDLLARYGGEEFAVIAQYTPPEGAHIFGERIRICVEENSTLALDADGNPIHVTVSVGVATVAAGAIVDAPKLIKETDGNLYKAKNEGRNRTVSSVLGQPLKK